MGRASNYRAPSEYEHWNPEHERARACARILGPSIERVRASIRASLIKGMQIFPLEFAKKKLIFLLSFFTSYFLCFILSVDNFFINWYRGENFFFSIWYCNFHIYNRKLYPFMLAEYSSSINPEHERARACARTSNPEHEHHKKDRAPSEHRASMCSDPSLVYGEFVIIGGIFNKLDRRFLVE